MIQRLRVPLGFVIAAAVLYWAQPTGVSLIAGLPVALAGGLFRAWAAGVIRKDSTLATAGPYGWTRNPLYFGSSLLALGFAMMSANIIAASVLLIPSILIYPIVIRREEAHLQRLFPDEFRLYCSKVPCFVPRLTRLQALFSFKQYVANREYNTALGFAGTLVVFVVKWHLTG
jgi:protein-S-isoprenylcysteine O-methyltransferase Ste14